MATEYQKLFLRKDYLSKHPCTCTKTSFFHSLWFAFYRIDFEHPHRDDPTNIHNSQLILF